VVAGSSVHGIRSHSTSRTAGSGTFTAVTVDRSSAVNNGRGVTVDGGRASILLTDSTIAGNGTGLFATNDGRLDYSNNNSITGNDTNVDEPPSGL
jgi:hypothetical protein